MIASHQHDIAGGVVRGECPSFAPALGDSRPELLSSHQKVSGVESLVVVLVHAQVCSPLPHDSPASPRPIGPPTVDSPKLPRRGQDPLESSQRARGDSNAQPSDP